MLNDKLVRWFSRPSLDRGANTVIGLPVTLITDVGKVRNENQDRVVAMRVNTTTLSSKPFAVVALVDGMGGMWNGSECAIRALSAFLNALIRFRHKIPLERLELAADIANMALYEISKGRGGATLSAVLFTSDQGAFTLNIGDSRIYAVVAGDKGEEVTRLTIDDSLEEIVGGNGKDLLQFVGMGVGLKPHVKVVPQNAKRILVSSDGVHFIRHETLCDSLLYARDTNDVAEQLITLATWRGAPDNASLAVTSLPEFSKCLSENEETGIEIWDPYGALHIMWQKQEQEQVDPQRAEARLSGPSDVSPKNALQPAVPFTRPKSSKKIGNPKVSKGLKNKSKSDLSPQLTIEIPSDANPGEGKK